MKISHRRHRGYTLMELLVTVAIVILLAGIVIATMPRILNSAKRRETHALVVRIEEGLSAFFGENGYYPPHPETRLPGSGIYGDDIARQGAVVLYQALSGDADMDGEIDPGATPFVEDLPAAAVEGGYAAVDLFGAPIRYLASPPGLPYDQRRTRNGRFDLWSLGGASNPNESFSWITHR